MFFLSSVKTPDVITALCLLLISLPNRLLYLAEFVKSPELTKLFLSLTKQRGRKAWRRGSGCITPFLALALNVSDQLHVSAALPPVKRSRF